MTENDNDQYNKEDEESPFYNSSSGLKWEEGLKKEISELFAWGKKADLTGIHDEPKSSKIIKYPFDRYIVTIELTSNNVFLGIREIQLNKDFRNYSQKKQTQISLDIEQYYFEE